MPIRHVILLKFAEGTNKAEASAAICEGLAVLPAKIPEIKKYQFGPDLGLDPERNHDFCLCAEFDSEADYEVYAKHPDHIAVIVADIKPVLAPGGRIAAQFAI